MGIAILGSLIGAAGTYAAAREQRKASEEALETNVNEAAVNREWIERMSNTAHQREVKDLNEAGLNPILSVTGGSGATSPVAPIASVPASGLAPKPNLLGSFVGSAKEMIKLQNEMMSAKADKVRAEAAKTEAEAADARQKADERHINEQIKVLQADENFKNWQSQSEAKKVQLLAEQIISEKKRQVNEANLTNARVQEAYAIAGAAVRNADINARRQAVDAELGRASSARDKERLDNEKKRLNYEYENGMRKVEREWVKDHPYWSHTLMTVDKVMEAVSPVKLRFLKD